MAWLIREGEVLAALDVADTFGARFRGLRGREGVLVADGVDVTHVGVRLD